MAKFKNVPDSMARLYEQAKSSLLLGTSDSIDDYLSMTLDTFDALFPMFKDDDDETKEAIIAKTKLDIVAVMMMATATQACHAGQYHAGENEERDLFDEAGLLSYWAAMNGIGAVGGE